MNDLNTSINLPEISLDNLIWNFLLCVVLSFILFWHFNVRSKKRYLRRDLGLVLPVICLTTLLVISVVKSSLALSLGLVGALSIVRFRTPIKEPEELAYIFLAIAIGLALGADQKEVAVLSLFIILAVISLIDKLRPKYSTTDSNLMLNIEVDQENASTKSILTTIEAIAPDANIRRIDQDNETLAITALVKVKDSAAINQFSTDFREKFPNGRFSFIDDSSMPNE
jgi:hypothetical protein